MELTASPSPCPSPSRSQSSAPLLPLLRAWLVAALAVVVILAVGCSASTDDATGPPGSVPPATIAPADVVAARLSGLGIVFEPALVSCASAKVLADPKLSGLGSSYDTPDNAELAGLVAVLYGCGANSETFAGLFVKSVYTPGTVLPTQDQCLHAEFAALSQPDVVLLLTQSDPAAADQVNQTITVRCGVRAEGA